MTERRPAVRFGAALSALFLVSPPASGQGAPPAAPAPTAAPTAPVAAPASPAGSAGFPVPGAPLTTGGLSLKRCLDLALKNFPRIHEALAKVRARRADIDLAHFAPYSEFLASGTLAPAPSVRGTSIFSPNSDAALTSNMGLAWQVGVEGMIPLWTFGKITNAWDAAEAGARASEHNVEKERNDVRLAVRRAYFGAKAAREGRVIVADGIRQLDRYIPGLESKVKSGDADQIDLLKLQMERASLEARDSQARQNEASALAALRFLTGLTGPIVLSSDPIVPPRQELGPLPRYLTAARLYRPEVNMVRVGILAQEAQVRLERARYFPDFGIGITARWARAPEVTDQRNPYASDRGNQLGYGAGLVFNYKLDFLPTIARVARAEADLEAIRASERFALGGVGVEVEEAFRQAEDAKRRLDAWSRAAELAERWLSQVEQRIAAGTFDEKEMFDPTRELSFRRFSRLEAMFDYHVALAKLAQTTGWEQDLGEE